MTTFNLGALSGSSTLISTGLNSLANGSTIDSAAVTANNARYGVFELALASVNLSAQTNPHVKAYAVPVGNDGSTYPGYVTGTAVSIGVQVPMQYYIGSFLCTSVNAAQNQSFVADMLKFNNRPWKLVLTNSLGAAFTSSGSTVTLKTYSEGY